MTIHECKERLFGFFAKHDTFSVAKHFNDVFAGSLKEEDILPVVAVTLDKLVEVGILERLKNGDCFVLTQPLGNYSQNIKVSGQTAYAVARLVARANQNHEEGSEMINPLRIEESDIQTLCVICAAAIGFERDVEEQSDNDVVERPKTIGFGA